MWDLEAFITTMMIGGGWAGAGVTRGGTAAIHGGALAGIPSVITHITTTITTTTTTGMAVTDTVGTVVDSLRSPRGRDAPQLQDRVEVQTAEWRPLAGAAQILEPHRADNKRQPIVLAQAPDLEVSSVATRATPSLAAEPWRRRVATQAPGHRPLRRTGERQLRELDKMAERVPASHRQVELTVP